MDRFSKWLRRQDAHQAPVGFITLGVLGTLVPGQLMLMGVFPPTPPAILATVAVAVASWSQMAIRRYRTRHELRIDARELVGTVKRWREGTAPHGEELEAAAVDLEQIEMLAGKTPLDASQAASLARSANVRLWRMFELTVAAPARHGLTLNQAEAQITEDARWISEARRLVESALEADEPRRLEDSLTDLRALVDAREAAFTELRG